MIQKAITSAYTQLAEKKYSRIFWCIDLHGTCIKSNYESGDYEWITPHARNVMKLISSYPESRIIIWSSCYPAEMENVKEFFKKDFIHIDYFNENPVITNTKTGCFDSKFYMSILLDDRAGFEPETDWITVRNTLSIIHAKISI